MSRSPNWSMVPSMRFLITLAAALLVSACVPARADPDDGYDPERGGALGGMVKVIDGDTLEVEGETVRISNIDAPEVGDGSGCWAEAVLAARARQQLIEFVNISKSIDVEDDPRGKDQYGRTLATVRLDGKDVGEAMVFAGLASKWTGERWNWCGSGPNLRDRNGPRLSGLNE